MIDHCGKDDSNMKTIAVTGNKGYDTSGRRRCFLSQMLITDEAECKSGGLPLISTHFC